MNFRSVSAVGADPGGAGSTCCTGSPPLEETPYPDGATAAVTPSLGGGWTSVILLHDPQSLSARRQPSFDARVSISISQSFSTVPRRALSTDGSTNVTVHHGHPAAGSSNNDPFLDLKVTTATLTAST